MTRREQVNEAILAAVDVLNERLPEDERVARDLGTEVLGPSRSVDSLGLVELVIEIEMAIRDRFDVNLNLANESALLTRPEGTIETVANYIDGMLENLGK
ncbi:MAG: hypothetical protein JSU96_18920 [Acidobacteriota bacterium]|nr:MAG: hypothetical protein JSU96_18920 [Acidobacteriota bacterium]